MQSAIGLIQLRHMADWSDARRRNASILHSAIAPFAREDGPVRLPAPKCAGCDGSCDAKGCHHGWYRFYVFVRQAELADGWSRDRIVSELQKLDVPCMQGSCSEIYLEKAFDDDESRPSARLAIARQLGEDSIAFLVHPTIDETTMTGIADATKTIFKQAARNA